MQIELESGLRFQINKSDYTAKVIHSPEVTGHVNIPFSITNWGSEYIVKSIGLEALKGNKDIIDVTFSEDSELTTIEDFAFSNSSIQKINFPNGLVNIGPNCFERADKLVEINIGEMNNHFEYIDNKYLVEKTKGQEGVVLIFARRDLEKAVIPPNVIKIAQRAFIHCDKLKAVTFSPNGCSLKEIGKRAFSLCNKLEYIQPFPACVNEFREYCFAGLNKLIRVEFLAENLEICDDSFYSCSNLALASFPNAKKIRLSDKAFNKTSPHFVRLAAPEAEIKIV